MSQKIQAAGILILSENAGWYLAIFRTCPVSGRCGKMTVGWFRFFKLLIYRYSFPTNSVLAIGRLPGMFIHTM